MTHMDLFLLAGSAVVALLLALAILAGVAGTRRREATRTVDQLLENATPGQIDALMDAVRNGDEEIDGRWTR